MLLTKTIMFTPDNFQREERTVLKLKPNLCAALMSSKPEGASYSLTKSLLPTLPQRRSPGQTALLIKATSAVPAYSWVIDFTSLTARGIIQTIQSHPFTGTRGLFIPLTLQTVFPTAPGFHSVWSVNSVWSYMALCLPPLCCEYVSLINCCLSHLSIVKCSGMPITLGVNSSLLWQRSELEVMKKFSKGNLSLNFLRKLLLGPLMSYPPTINHTSTSELISAKEDIMISIGLD